MHYAGYVWRRPRKPLTDLEFAIIIPERLLICDVLFQMMDADSSSALPSEEYCKLMDGMTQSMSAVRELVKSLREKWVDSISV